nr:MAG TPA: hypothetical protein [Caudoviricetes sp.]
MSFVNRIGEKLSISGLLVFTKKVLKRHVYIH